MGGHGGAQDLLELIGNDHLSAPGCAICRRRGAATEIQLFWSPKTRFAVMEEGGSRRAGFRGKPMPIVPRRAKPYPKPDNQTAALTGP